MIVWRKSSYSGSTSTQSDCVEVARLAGRVGVRDSEAPDAGHLALSPRGFADLIAQVRRDGLDGAA